MFYIDWLYIILVLPPMIFAMWASFKVNSTFKKYSVIPTVRGMTGAEAARRILFESGVYDVKIEHVGGNLTDHYDPKSKVLRLSDAT